MTVDLPSMDFSSLNVLLCDDDPAYRKILSSILKKTFKVNVREATNPQEAFDLIKETIPDLLVLDMQMPVMDGLTALKFIRSNDSTKDLPVIACTALSYGDLFLNLAKLHIADYIVKPSNAKIITGKFQKALNDISKRKK